MSRNLEKGEKGKVLSEAPKVFCPKENRKVPIWWCLGSYTKGRETCPYLVKAEVNMAENWAKVECKLKG